MLSEMPKYLSMLQILIASSDRDSIHARDVKDHLGHGHHVSGTARLKYELKQLNRNMEEERHIQ